MAWKYGANESEHDRVVSKAKKIAKIPPYDESQHTLLFSRVIYVRAHTHTRIPLFTFPFFVGKGTSKKKENTKEEKLGGRESELSRT